MARYPVGWNKRAIPIEMGRLFMAWYPLFCGYRLWYDNGFFNDDVLSNNRSPDVDRLSDNNFRSFGRRRHDESCTTQPHR